MGLAAMGAATQDPITSPAELPPPATASYQLGQRDVNATFSMVSSLDASDQIFVQVTVDTRGKCVRLSFEYPDESNGIGIPVFYGDEVAVGTNFFPTGAVYLGEDRLAVSGMDAFTGLGRIEVWKVTKPAVYRVPSTEGQVQIFVRGGTVGSVDMGFQAKTDDGFGLVRALWRNMGAGDHHVLVLTHPADVLYSVDLKNHTAQPLAMPTTAVGNQPPVAMLGEGWAGYHGPSRHVSLGFVYSLSKAEGLANDEIDSLFICDSDADGVPDNFLPISREIFESLGLEDATQWTHNKW